jgi:hypothetical protein
MCPRVPLERVGQAWMEIDRLPQIEEGPCDGPGVWPNCIRHESAEPYTVAPKGNSPYALSGAWFLTTNVRVIHPVWALAGLEPDNCRQNRGSWPLR